MATIGIAPAVAKPPAKHTAHASAMPTSKKRSGYLSRNFARPVPSHVAAVTATTRGLAAASSRAHSANTLVYVGLEDLCALPVTLWHLPRPWNVQASASAGS